MDTGAWHLYIGKTLYLHIIDYKLWLVSSSG